MYLIVVQRLNNLSSPSKRYVWKYVIFIYDQFINNFEKMDNLSVNEGYIYWNKWKQAYEKLSRKDARSKDAAKKI